MSANPAFAATVRRGSVLVPATNDTSFTAPTHVSTVCSAGASGSKIDEVRVLGVGTTVNGRVNLFRYDGTSYWLIDQFLITATTPAATVKVNEIVQGYDNLLLSSADTLVCTVMEASNESLLCVTAMGGDF
jgi:hypothetical protein